jgi:AcrR family transcriptional regulator
MLIHHFGSREGLLAAVTRAVEEQQQAALLEPDATLPDARQSRYHALIFISAGFSGAPGAIPAGRGSAVAASARIRLIRRRCPLLAGVPVGPTIELGEPGSLVGDVHDLRTRGRRFPDDY